MLHADSITKENGNGKRKRSLGCARDDETGKGISYIPFHSAVNQPPLLWSTSFQRKEGECRRNRTAIPRTSPSGRPLVEEGGRMPFFRIVISSESEKSFSSPFPMTPSLSLLGKAPPPLFRDTVFPVPCCQTLSALPPTKKIPRLRSEGRNGERPLPISFHSAVSQPPPLRTASFQGKEGECRLPL